MSIDDSNFNVVLEEVSDEGAHMLVVHFPKKTGGFGRLRIPRGLLLETAKARVLFANHGAILPEDCVAVFKALLEQEVPTIRVVRKAGWHERQYLSRFGRVGTKGEDKFKLATGEHKERKRITRGAAEVLISAES